MYCQSTSMYYFFSFCFRRVISFSISNIRRWLVFIFSEPSSISAWASKSSVLFNLWWLLQELISILADHFLKDFQQQPFFAFLFQFLATFPRPCSFWQHFLRFSASCSPIIVSHLSQLAGVPNNWHEHLKRTATIAATLKIRKPLKNYRNVHYF